MKKALIITALSFCALLCACGAECLHEYTKWSMDAEEHWIACDLCGRVEYPSTPHEWVVISQESVDGTGVVTSMCAMCGLTTSESTEICREVTNDEWDKALSLQKFDNVTATYYQKDGSDSFNATYYICGERVREEILPNGSSQGEILDISASDGVSYLLSTLAKFTDTFGGFEYDSEMGHYYYERTEQDGSLTTFTFAFEFGRLTELKITADNGAYVSGFSFSDYGSTSAE